MKHIIVLLLALSAVIGCTGDFDETQDPGDYYAEAWEAPTNNCVTVIRDCNGNTLDDDHLTIRDDCRHYRNCVFPGNVRIRGTYSSGGHADAELSHLSKWVRFVRSDAPYGVTIEDSTIDGQLYIAPGVTFARIARTTIRPPSGCTVALYLDAESSRNVIADNTIDASTCNRAVAVDASDHNAIVGNDIIVGSSGIGMELYRNCGESAVTRQTTPSYNEISGNSFNDVGALGLAIWIGRRSAKNIAQLNIGTGFCLDDEGTPDDGLGSSASNLDWARWNVVKGNTGGAVFESPTFDVYGNEVD